MGKEGKFGDILPLETRIIEDRSEVSSYAEVVDAVEQKSFAEEIENDKNKAGVYLLRASQATTQLGEDNPITRQEQAAVGVYKRVLLLVGSGGLEIKDDAGHKKLASENGLPAASYLTHGSRVLIEVPAGTGHELINWLTSGTPDKSGMSTQYDQKSALAEGKPVYSRLAATHDVDISAGSDGQFTLTEKKTGLFGFLGDLKDRTFGTHRHHGIDLALDAEFNGKDSEGKVVGAPDGNHGHLYIHYIPPQASRPGSILMGVEAAAPSSPKHSKTGATDIITATAGSQFEDLAVKKQIAGEHEYSNTLVPKKYGGMSIKLDKAKLEQITQTPDTNYDYRLVSAIPAESPDTFLHSPTYHTTPHMQPPKTLPSPQKPSILQGIASVLTLGRAYKVEREAYKAAKAVEAKHNKIIFRKVEETKPIVIDLRPIQPIEYTKEEKKALTKFASLFKSKQSKPHQGHASPESVPLLSTQGQIAHHK